jgi:hypothetical protein
MFFPCSLTFTPLFQFSKQYLLVQLDVRKKYLVHSPGKVKAQQDASDGLVLPAPPLFSFEP